MIASRRIPNAAPFVTNSPSESGPRWTMRSHIECSSSRAPSKGGVVDSRLAQPVIPHIRKAVNGESQMVNGRTLIDLSRRSFTRRAIQPFTIYHLRFTVFETDLFANGVDRFRLRFVIRAHHHLSKQAH